MKNSDRILSAVVLAAGLSKRMGTANKLLLPYKNSTLIRTVVQHILNSGIEEVIIVVGHEAEKVKTALFDLPVQFVLNGQFEMGMTTSIQEGVRHATGAGYMICLADMVLITAEEYVFMKNEFLRQLHHDPSVICLPRYKNEKGNPVIFSSLYRDAILMHGDMEGCKDIVQQSKAHIHWMEMTTPHILQDVDYPKDYQNVTINY